SRLGEVRSWPAEKPKPAPRRITTRTASSTSARWRPASRAANMASLKALRRSGRLSVRYARGPSVSYSTSRPAPCGATCRTTSSSYWNRYCLITPGIRLPSVLGSRAARACSCGRRPWHESLLLYHGLHHLVVMPADDRRAAQDDGGCRADAHAAGRADGGERLVDVRLLVERAVE